MRCFCAKISRIRTENLYIKTVLTNDCADIGLFIFFGAAWLLHRRKGEGLPARAINHERGNKVMRELTVEELDVVVGGAPIVIDL